MHRFNEGTTWSILAPTFVTVPTCSPELLAKEAATTNPFKRDRTPWALSRTLGVAERLFWKHSCFGAATLR